MSRIGEEGGGNFHFVRFPREAWLRYVLRRARRVVIYTAPGFVRRGAGIA